MAVFTVSLQQASGVGDVNLGDGTTLATLAVSAGRGPKGDGFTGGTYDAGTGKVTFTSNDGIGFETGDLRGDLTEPGPIGSVTPNTGAFTSLSTTGNAVIGGDLTVEGTTTTVDSTTVAVGDKNIELAKDATTPAEADGGGITLTGASATITYSSANDYWALNKGLNVSGNVSLSGTVDGRDVAADGSKLDGIESGATADQTAGEIKTAYESNADTNAFTDAEQSKLAGIEAGADVTDTTNVTAAGALMDSELTSEASVKALDQGVATTDSPDFAGLSVDTNTLYVDSANNRAGIGTSSPSNALDVETPDARAAVFTSTATNVHTSDSTVLIQNTGDTTVNTTNHRLLDLDYAGDATVAPGEYIRFLQGGSEAATFGINSNDLTFRVNASEAMRIDSSGNLLVAQSSSGNPGAGNTVEGICLNSVGLGSFSRSAGVAGTFNRNTSNGAVVGFYRQGVSVGSISVTASGTSYNESSDKRLKENIADAQPASDLIDGIQVRQFDWKADGEHRRYGMIAQELEAVAPEAVTKGETEDDMWAVDYSKLVPMLVKEIQDLRKRVSELEATA